MSKMEALESLKQTKQLAYDLQNRLRDLTREEKDLLNSEQFFKNPYRKYLKSNCWQLIFAINRLIAKNPENLSQTETE